MNTGSGDGTLRLDVLDDDTIRDAGENPLEGSGAGNGNYVKGQAFVIDRQLPVVTEVLRAGASPTNASSVSFLLHFNEPVSGVDATDFSLSAPGLSGAVVDDA